MSAIPPPQGLSLEDFEAIEAAVSETTRGRWFLAEFARRTRAQDTERMLEALARLEQRMIEAGPQIAPPSDPQIAEALAAVCERLRDIAWTLRERGLGAGLCGAIESEAHILARLQPPVERLCGPATDPPTPRSASLTDRIEPLRPVASAPSSAQTSASAVPLPEAGRAPRPPTLAEIDALPLHDKLEFFA